MQCFDPRPVRSSRGGALARGFQTLSHTRARLASAFSVLVLLASFALPASTRAQPTLSIDPSLRLRFELNAAEIASTSAEMPSNRGGKILCISGAGLALVGAFTMTVAVYLEIVSVAATAGGQIIADAGVAVTDALTD